MKAEENDILDGSWERDRGEDPGSAPRIPIRIPEKWPVQRFYQIVVYGGKHVKKEMYIWLN